MTSQLQSRILKALFAALRPLAKALLRAGIGYREFSEAAKAAFITEATEGFGVRGRATNISRVAVMTGLSRKEVKRIRDEGLDVLFGGHFVESPASVVLSRWHTDPKFLDKNGAPKRLYFDKGEHSFVDLVKGCAGDIPPGALRAELNRVGAISEDSERQLTVRSRHFIPKGLDDRLIIGLEDIVAADIETLAFNCSPGLDRQSRYHRVTSVDGIKETKLAIIQAEANLRLADFANNFDDYLLKNLDGLADDDHDKSCAKQVGIGMFYFERDISKS